jgi:hypothetical protein
MLQTQPNQPTPMPHGALGPVVVTQNWRADAVLMLKALKAFNPYVMEVPRKSLIDEVGTGFGFAPSFVVRTPGTGVVGSTSKSALTTLEQRRAMRYDIALIDMKSKKKEAAEAVAVDALMASSSGAWVAMVAASDTMRGQIPIRLTAAGSWGDLIDPLLTSTPPTAWLSEDAWTDALKKFTWRWRRRA